MIKFNPQVTQRLAKKLYLGTPETEGLLDWAGTDIGASPEHQQELVKHAQKLLPQASASALQVSLGSLLHGTPTNAEIEFVCYRIAANIHLINSGVGVPPWIGLSESIEAPVEIVYVAPGWSKGPKPAFGTVLTFKIIDGPLCPLQFSRWFPDRYLWIMAKDLAVGKSRSPTKYQGKRNEFFGLRFVAKLVPGTEPQSLTFERFRVGQFKHHNQQLFKERHEPCIHEKQLECHRCTLGRDACHRACRPRSLERRFCLACDKETWHDGSTCGECRFKLAGSTHGQFYSVSTKSLGTGRTEAGLSSAPGQEQSG